MLDVKPHRDGRPGQEEGEGCSAVSPGQLRTPKGRVGCIPAQHEFNPQNCRRRRWGSPSVRPYHGVLPLPGHRLGHLSQESAGFQRLQPHPPGGPCTRWEGLVSTAGNGDPWSALLRALTCTSANSGLWADATREGDGEGQPGQGPVHPVEPGDSTPCSPELCCWTLASAQGRWQVEAARAPTSSAPCL